MFQINDSHAIDIVIHSLANKVDGRIYVEHNVIDVLYVLMWDKKCG